MRVNICDGCNTIFNECNLTSVISVGDCNLRLCPDCLKIYKREQKVTVTKNKKTKTDVLDKITAEIEGWQTDIHDNEYDAKNHDFVFERIYEIIDKYRESKE